MTGTSTAMRVSSMGWESFHCRRVDATALTPIVRYG